MIHIHGLTKIFGKTHTALNGVSIDVRVGECIALLGPNGSGKTTLLKCLAGLVHPTAGTFSIGGVDAASAEARRSISYLPQQTGFAEHLRVREVLDFYGKLRGLPQRRVDEVLDLIDCRGFANRAVADLSGGMRQRLAIAVVCLPASPVLLLDEPTASLDPQNAARFRDTLCDLKRLGTTIVMATHLLSDVRAVADRIAILMDGRLMGIERVSPRPVTLEDIYLRYVHVETPTRDFDYDDRSLPAGAAQAS